MLQATLHSTQQSGKSASMHSSHWTYEQQLQITHMADITDLSPPSDWQTGFTSHWTYKQQLQTTHMADITDLSPPSDWQTGFTSY